MDSVDGRRPRRNSEYCNAVLRAAILEGEVYFLTNGREGTREIQVALFPPDRELFETQVSCTFIDSNQSNPLSDVQRALGYNDLFKKVQT